MNKIKLPKSILITQGELTKYAGSEIVTLELAEFFSQNGCIVHVLTNWIGPPIVKDFNKLKNVTLHTTTQGINFDRLELIWIHHNLIPPEVIELAIDGALKAKVVFHHMSSILPIEYPFFPAIEKGLASQILFNSFLSKDVILAKTKDIQFSGIVFNNPAPSLFQTARLVHNRKLRRILVVSSHVPKEVTQATKILAKKGIVTKFIGDSTRHDFRRVTPKDIMSSDIVITIGKTVQYAMQSGTPVYCYDHFGGPGYLNIDNFTRASWYGFSGKGFSKKSPTVIAKNIITDFDKAQSDAAVLEKKYSRDYLLPEKIDTVLKSIEKTQNKKLKITHSQHQAFLAVSEVYQSYYKGYKQSIEYSQILQQHSQNLEREISDTHNSISWKLTGPLRTVKALVKNFEFNIKNKK